MDWFLLVSFGRKTTAVAFCFVLDLNIVLACYLYACSLCLDPNMYVEAGDSFELMKRPPLATFGLAYDLMILCTCRIERTNKILVIANVSMKS